MTKRVLLIGALLLLITAYIEAVSTVFIIKVQEEKNFDFAGMRTFRISLSDSTAITIIGDEDLPIVKHLLSLEGKRVSLTFEPTELETIR